MQDLALKILMERLDALEEKLRNGNGPVTVRFSKLHPDAEIPTKAHPSDAGFDIKAVGCSRDSLGNYVYRTGLAVEIPEGYVGLLFPRSSIFKKNLALTNAVGVIDSGYRGEIHFIFSPVPKKLYWESPVFYEPGDHIGQMIVIPYPEVVFQESDCLSDSDRGQDGLGSSGR